MEILETLFQRQRIFFGRIRWLLCGPFREFKKCHKKWIETSQEEGKKLEIFFRGLTLFM